MHIYALAIPQLHKIAVLTHVYIFTHFTHICPYLHTYA